MRVLLKLLMAFAVLVVVLVVGTATYLLIAPPDLLRVATGYAAKIVCSNVFIAGRDPEEVLKLDVQAPGHPILKYVRVTTDVPTGRVKASLLGLFAPSLAVNRSGGFGCTSVPDGDETQVLSLQGIYDQLPQPAINEADWPAGSNVAFTPDMALEAVLTDRSLTGPGMRAVVVVRDGKIVGEAYGDGATPQMPLLGWSMTKTVTAALIGMLVKEGRMDLDETGLVADWTDARKGIRLRDLLGMESGLQFNEDYGEVSDVNRMLFLEPDMAGFTASRPMVAAPEELFNYSSGTSTLLSRIWMDRLGAMAPFFPSKALFGPLGMTSAVIEMDESGTLVGSSYMYATARDWARFGLFLLRDGNWNGSAMLPEGWVAAMDQSNGLPGDYSQMQSWITGPRESDGLGDVGLPPDTFWLAGHDGQSIAVIPSRDIVVVRLGLTPSRLGYWPEKLAKAVVDASP